MHDHNSVKAPAIFAVEALMATDRNRRILFPWFSDDVVLFFSLPSSHHLFPSLRDQFDVTGRRFESIGVARLYKECDGTTNKRKRKTQSCCRTSSGKQAHRETWLYRQRPTTVSRCIKRSSFRWPLIGIAFRLRFWWWPPLCCNSSYYYYYTITYLRLAKFEYHLSCNPPIHHRTESFRFYLQGIDWGKTTNGQTAICYWLNKIIFQKGHQPCLFVVTDDSVRNESIKPTFLLKKCSARLCTAIWKAGCRRSQFIQVQTFFLGK